MHVFEYFEVLGVLEFELPDNLQGSKPQRSSKSYLRTVSDHLAGQQGSEGASVSVVD